MYRKRKDQCPFIIEKKNWLVPIRLERGLRSWGYKAKKTFRGPAHRIAGTQTLQQIRIQCGKVWSHSSSDKRKEKWLTVRSVCVSQVVGQGREYKDGLYEEGRNTQPETWKRSGICQVDEPFARWRSRSGKAELGMCGGLEVVHFY